MLSSTMTTGFFLELLKRVYVSYCGYDDILEERLLDFLSPLVSSTSFLLFLRGLACLLPIGLEDSLREGP